MTIAFMPQCFECRHYAGKEFNESELRTDYFCKAFPKGIPFEIISGERKHNKPYKGDNGIQYEPA